MSGERSCRKFRVTGKVQGVWFRESTRREAKRLGLDGHAVNKPDGSVEVVAAGSEADLDTLEKWLQQGPPMARVDQVESEPHPDTDQSGFRTG